MSVVLIPPLAGGQDARNAKAGALQVGSDGELRVDSIYPSFGWAPSSGELELTGRCIPVVIYGQGFENGTIIGTLFLHILSYTVRSDTQITAQFCIEQDTPRGPYVFSVGNPDGEVVQTGHLFTVLEARPEVFPSGELIVTSVDPSSAKRGETIVVEVRGEGFVFVEDGMRVRSDWDETGPFTTTLTMVPDVITNPVYILNSTLMYITISTSSAFPPQEIMLRMCNPTLERPPLDLRTAKICEQQRDQTQMTVIFFTIERGDDEPARAPGPSQSLCARARPELRER